MRILHSAHWHTSVSDSGPESLTGHTLLLSTDLECSVFLRVNKKTFNIESAVWKVFRSPGSPVSREIKNFRGIEAYLGSGPTLKKAAAESGSEEALPLVNETVRGIIQAETFVFKERGFNDSQAYDQYWNTMYANSCRYYSNLNKVKVRWEEYISGQNRFGILYNKFKCFSAYENGQFIEARGQMSDSFHEVSIISGMDKETGEVRTLDCRLVRGPDPVCFEAGSLGKKLVGKKISAMSKKEMARELGGGQGCIHIIDTWHDLARILKEVRQSL
ncbi:MAG: DUF2889 domain-containing protein [Bacillota bacterium]